MFTHTHTHPTSNAEDRLTKTYIAAHCARDRATADDLMSKSGK